MMKTKNKNIWNIAKEKSYYNPKLDFNFRIEKNEEYDSYEIFVYEIKNKVTHLIDHLKGNYDIIKRVLLLQYKILLIEKFAEEEKGKNE